MIPIRQYWSLLHRYLRHQRRRIVLLAVVLSVGIGLQVANPQLVKLFIDRALGGDAVGRLLPLAVAFLVVAFSQQAFTVTAAWVAGHVGWDATNELREDLAGHLLRLDMGFHKQHTPGEMVERIDGDVTALSNFFSQFAVQVVGNAALVVGVLALMIVESPLVGLPITALAAVTVGFLGWLQRRATEWWRRERASSARYFGFVGEAITAAEDVQGNGAGGYVRSRAARIHREWLPRHVRGWHSWSLSWSANTAYFGAANAIVFALGAWSFARGDLTLGSVYLLAHYAEMIRHPIERIREQMDDMQKAGAAVVRVRELLDVRNPLPDHGTAELPAGSLSVELRRVDFAYGDGNGDGERVLHDLNLHLEAGRVLGVLGRTGSGKTTIARLLTRLYDPEEGEILLGGLPAPAVPVAALRSRVGIVTQDVQLFRASIRDNLTFFDAAVPDQRLWEALERLGLDGWVRALPDGLDTMLEGGGGGLSAGEAQLLAFTRIFLEDPGLVILDEASSRLDPATERLIHDATEHLLDGRTGVVIAHRLDTVQRADDIVIMEAGRIVEFGPRADLAADPGSRFATLLRSGIEEVLA